MPYGLPPSIDRDFLAGLLEFFQKPPSGSEHIYGVDPLQDAVEAANRRLLEANPLATAGPAPPGRPAQTAPYGQPKDFINEVSMAASGGVPASGQQAEPGQRIGPSSYSSFDADRIRALAQSRFQDEDKRSEERAAILAAAEEEAARAASVDEFRESLDYTPAPSPLSNIEAGIAV